MSGPIQGAADRAATDGTRGRWRQADVPGLLLALALVLGAAAVLGFAALGGWGGLCGGLTVMIAEGLVVWVWSTAG